MKSRKEIAYDWSKIPEDLPKSNLLYITAKTTHATIHPDDPEYPIRLFTPAELQESAASLRRRPIGVNHIHAKFNPEAGLIKGAFTVDAQWNPSTQAIEALVFLPSSVMEMVREKKRNNEAVEWSVEYGWRDEHKTEAGTEFTGLCFYRIDMLEGFHGGDHYTSSSLIESESKTGRFLAEAEFLVEMDTVQQENIDQSLEHSPSIPPVKLEEAEMNKYLGEPFADYQNWKDCIAKNRDKSDPSAYCGYIKHKTESMCAECGNCKGNNRVECQACLKLHNLNKGIHPEAYRQETYTQADDPTVKHPNGTNQMKAPPETPILNQPPQGEFGTDRSLTNVASAGAVAGTKGVVFGEPEEGNPHKNLDIPPAQETKIEGEDQPPVKGIQDNGNMEVIGLDDKSKQATECNQSHINDKTESDNMSDKGIKESPLTTSALASEAPKKGEGKQLDNGTNGTNGAPLAQDLTGGKQESSAQSPVGQVPAVHEDPSTGQSISSSASPKPAGSVGAQEQPPSPPTTGQAPAVAKGSETGSGPAPVEGKGTPNGADLSARLTEAEVKIANYEAQVKELNSIVKKLQEAATSTDKARTEAINVAYKKGKQDVIERITKVVPTNSLIGGPNVGAVRVLINDVKKVLFEMQKD
jgi:hypothetical protein